MTAYPGGKNGTGVYHAIINEIPKHRVYIEPFLGSGAILRRKKPADTSWACEWYEQQFKAFDPGDQFHTSTRLVDMDFLRDDQDQRIFYDAKGEVPRLWVKHTDALKFLREFMFQGERDHYLVYMDPPYLMEMRSTKAKCYTKDFSTWFEHEELLSLAVSMNANVMISGYDHPLYNERLAGWRKIEFTGQTRGGPRTEVVWMNFAEPAELHDYRYLGKDYRERENIRKQQKRWVQKLKAMPRQQRYALRSAIEEVLSADTGENGGAIAPIYQRPSAEEVTSTTAAIAEAREIDAAGFVGRDHEQHPTRGISIPAESDGAGSRKDIIPARQLKKGDFLVYQSGLYQARTPNKHHVFAVWPGSDSGPIINLDTKVRRLPKPTDAWLAEIVKVELGVNEHGIFDDGRTSVISLYSKGRDHIRIRLAYSAPLDLWFWGYDYAVKTHGGSCGVGLPTKHREYRQAAVTKERAIEAATNFLRRGDDLRKIIDRPPAKKAVRAPKRGPLLGGKPLTMMEQRAG